MTDAPQTTTWSFNLDKAAAKYTKAPLKDPLGFKCNTNDVIVRSGQSKTSNMSQVETLENKAWALAKSPSG